MTNLTRWSNLFDQDETLRPKSLVQEPPFWWIQTPSIRATEPMPIEDEHAELLIIAKAIQWLNRKHEGLTIGDGHFDIDYEDPECPFSGFSAHVFGPVIDEVRSGQSLIDALYNVVIAVKEREEEEIREDRKRNSLFGRIKRKLNDWQRARSEKRNYEIPNHPITYQRRSTRADQKR